jgi:hypothetical protein
MMQGCDGGKHMTPPDEPYDRSFFDLQSQRSLQSAQVVLGRLLPLLQPGGCWMSAAESARGSARRSTWASKR